MRGAILNFNKTLKKKLQFFLKHIIQQMKNEMNRALGHLCAHIG